MSVLRDKSLEDLLAELHAKSEAQLRAIADGHAKGANPLPPRSDPEGLKAFLSDKLVSLRRDKAEFCYQLLRATGARRIVEIGTSYGVSTLYLAAALRDGGTIGGTDGIVIATEHEPEKARHARQHLEHAGLAALVDLRVGDLRETLRCIEGPIDFVLVDIWVDIACDALKLVYPHLKPGAIVICDNTNNREAYADYFSFVDAPANQFRTMTLPFEGGLELSVFAPCPRIDREAVAPCT